MFICSGRITYMLFVLQYYMGAKKYPRGEIEHTSLGELVLIAPTKLNSKY